MTDERTPRKLGVAGKTGPPRRPTEAEVVEELRRSRGEGGDRPSEGEPPPPHYGRGSSSDGD